MFASQGFKVLLEQSSHLDDPVSHALDLTEPLLVELGVVQDLAGNSGSVDGRVGVQWAHEDLDLGVDALLLLGRLAHDTEGADSLAVQAHVLGEGLRQDEAVTLLDEETDRVGVLVGVTAREALVGHVEEGVVRLLFHDGADLAPLLRGRVDTGGVVGAGVEEDHAAFRRGLEVLDHAVKVQAYRVLVVVRVVLDLEP